MEAGKEEESSEEGEDKEEVEDKCTEEDRGKAESPGSITNWARSSKRPNPDIQPCTAESGPQTTLGMFLVYFCNLSVPIFH